MWIPKFKPLKFATCRWFETSFDFNGENTALTAIPPDSVIFKGGIVEILPNFGDQ